MSHPFTTETICEFIELIQHGHSPMSTQDELRVLNELVLLRNVAETFAVKIKVLESKLKVQLPEQNLAGLLLSSVENLEEALFELHQEQKNRNDAIMAAEIRRLESELKAQTEYSIELEQEMITLRADVDNLQKRIDDLNREKMIRGIGDL